MNYKRNLSYFTNSLTPKIFLGLSVVMLAVGAYIVFDWGWGILGTVAMILIIAGGILFFAASSFIVKYGELENCIIEIDKKFAENFKNEFCVSNVKATRGASIASDEYVEPIFYNDFYYGDETEKYKKAKNIGTVSSTRISSAMLIEKKKISAAIQKTSLLKEEIKTEKFSKTSEQLSKAEIIKITDDNYVNMRKYIFIRFFDIDGNALLDIPAPDDANLDSIMNKINKVIESK